MHHLLYLGDFEEKGSQIYEIKKAHKSIIYTIDAVGGNLNYGTPEVVTGGKDGNTKIWDLRSDKPAIILEQRGIESRK